MKKVVLIFTGGTISMKLDDSSQSIVPAFSASEIMSNLLNSDLYDDLETVEFSKVPSPNITPSILMSLSSLVQSYLSKNDIAGVVIVHGTDTLEESAFFLDVLNHSSKPIVFTGSMKSSSELGFDGVNNLVSSILVCKSPDSIGRGVLVVMNDQINAASEVTKSNTLSLDTFKSLDYGPIGIVDSKQVIFHRDVSYPRVHVDASRIMEPVYLLKSYSGMDSTLLDVIASRADTKGVVIEALGRGNLPPSTLSGISSLIEKNIPVIITSRCPSGRSLDTYGYPGGGKDLVDHGCIFASNLNGQKARILLMLVLSKINSIEEIREYFK